MGKNKSKDIKDNKKQKSPKPPLPHGWIVQVSKTYPDRVYYFNKFTGNTTWETPIATDIENAAARKVKKVKKSKKRHKVSKKKSTANQIEVVPDSKELSGPEDYVDEDDDAHPFPPRPHLTPTKQTHKDVVQEIEICPGSSQSVSDSTTTKGSSFHKDDYTKSRLEHSSSHKDEKANKIYRNEKYQSSNNTKQSIPVKPAIKKYDIECKPVNKIKPIVRFAETVSPKFSSDSDNEKLSPPSFQESPDSQSEPEKHYSEIPLPPSPSEDSVYKKIELNSLSTQPSSSTKSVSELYSGLDLPKNDIKSCRPFSVSDLKKTNIKRNLVTKKFKCQQPENKSETNVINNAATSVMAPQYNLPASLVSDTSNTNVFGKRKRLEENVVPLSQNDICSPLPQSKKVAASSCDSDDFITSDFFLWDSDEISSHKPTSPFNKNNSSDIPVGTLSKLSNVLLSDEIQTAISSDVSAPETKSKPETPGLIYFSVKTITRKPIQTHIPVFDDDVDSSKEIQTPIKNDDLPKELQTPIPEFEESDDDMPKELQTPIPEFEESDDDMPTELQTPIPEFEESDVDMPKEVKLNLSMPPAACNSTSSANSMNSMKPLTPSILPLDSVGMENTSSSSSAGAGVTSMWENLLRPKSALHFPRSFGSSSHQPVQSFANLWGNKPKHENNTPVNLEEDMDWEPNSLEIPKNHQKETTESNKLYGDYCQTSWYIIVDTNVLLHEIKFIKEFRDTTFEGVGLPVIVIPWIVLQELDNLKAPKNKISVNQENISRARAAVSFILENLSSNHPRLKGQSFDEFSQHNYTNCSNNDDKILHFCSTLKKKGCQLVLLTEDKNFRNKAIASKLEACSVRELQKKSSQVAQVWDETSQDISDPPDKMVNVQNAEVSKADQIFCKTKVVMFKIVKQVLVHGMKKFGNTMWQRMVIKKPPWTLNDILYCLNYHWVAVFKYELPTNAQNHITELQKCFRSTQGYNYTLTEVTNLVETSLSLCSCIDKKKLLSQLVTDSNLELRRLLVACHGGDLEVLSLDSQSSSTNSNSPQLHPRKQSDEELQEVQNHFTALWERTNAFCIKLEALMSNAQTSGSSSVDLEIEKNISTILRTVKQVIQINEKLLVTSVIQPESCEIQELHSILLSESSSDFDEELFSEEALCEFYHRRREELKMAQQSFQGFVSIINNAIKFLMSKHK